MGAKANLLVKVRQKSFICYIFSQNSLSSNYYKPSKNRWIKTYMFTWLIFIFFRRNWTYCKCKYYNASASIYASHAKISCILYARQIFSSAFWYLITTQMPRCKENRIFFFHTSWKDGLYKKIALEHNLSRIIEKDHVSLSRKYNLNLRRKMTDDLFQKKYKEIWYFLQVLRKEGLFKKGRARTWSFFYYVERWFFFPKTIFFLWAGSQRWRLPRNTWKYDIFCVQCGCYKPDVRPPCLKKRFGDFLQWIIFNTLYHSAPTSRVYRCACALIK